MLANVWERQHGMRNKANDLSKSSSTTAAKNRRQGDQLPMWRLLLWAGMLVLAVCLPAHAAGNVITVCEAGGDYTTIQAAVNAASSDDIVSVCPGVYQENIVLRARVSIQGEGSDVTIVDGGATQSVVRSLTADIGSDTIVSGLTLRNGRATSGGGILVRQGSPLFKNLVIENNVAWQDQGGGVAVLDGARVTLTNVVARNNRANRGGGVAVAGSNSRLEMVNSLISANNATSGGGAALAGARAFLSLVNTSVQNNVSDSVAGGVMFDILSSGRVDGAGFQGNQARDGGALYVVNANVAINGVEFTDNVATGHAGAVAYVQRSTCLLYTSPSPRDRTRYRMPSSA